MTINPMFQSKSKHPVTKVQHEKVNEIRKTRSDKKTDVKVPVTLEQKKLLRRAARSANFKEVTPFVSFAVKRGLARQAFNPKFKHFYPSDSSITVHVKLESRYIDMLDDLCIEWDCSRRQAAYSVLFTIVEMDGGYVV